MGVQGLWQLLQATGRPVSLESLEGKVLAIDISIWLHKSTKGVRGKDGAGVPNAHLLSLFHRLCKLYFYRIKPIFVFDGGVPVLKRQTMAGRKQRAELADIKSKKSTEKILTNYIQSQAIRKAVGKETKDAADVLPLASTSGPDLFELPPIPENDGSSDDDPNMSWEERVEQREIIHSSFQDIQEIDVTSEDFKALPPEIRHEILTELKETRKRSHWKDVKDLPEDSGDFSSYRMSRLITKSKLSNQLEEARKEMNSRSIEGVVESLPGTGEIQSRRVMSQDASHVIFVKGMKNAGVGTKKKGSRPPPLKAKPKAYSSGRVFDLIASDSKPSFAVDTSTVRKVKSTEPLVKIADFSKVKHTDSVQNKKSIAPAKSTVEVLTLNEESIKCQGQSERSSDFQGHGDLESNPEKSKGQLQDGLQLSRQGQGDKMSSATKTQGHGVLESNPQKSKGQGQVGLQPSPQGQGQRDKMSSAAKTEVVDLDDSGSDDVEYMGQESDNFKQHKFPKRIKIKTKTGKLIDCHVVPRSSKASGGGKRRDIPKRIDTGEGGSVESESDDSDLEVMGSAQKTNTLTSPQSQKRRIVPVFHDASKSVGGKFVFRVRKSASSEQEIRDVGDILKTSNNMEPVDMTASSDSDIEYVSESASPGKSPQVRHPQHAFLIQKSKQPKYDKKIGCVTLESDDSELEEISNPVGASESSSENISGQGLRLLSNDSAFKDLHTRHAIAKPISINNGVATDVVTCDSSKDSKDSDEVISVESGSNGGALKDLHTRHAIAEKGVTRDVVTCDSSKDSKDSDEVISVKSGPNESALKDFHDRHAIAKQISTEKGVATGVVTCDSSKDSKDSDEVISVKSGPVSIDNDIEVSSDSSVKGRQSEAVVSDSSDEAETDEDDDFIEVNSDVTSHVANDSASDEDADQAEPTCDDTFDAAAEDAMETDAEIHVDDGFTETDEVPTVKEADDKATDLGTQFRNMTEEDVDDMLQSLDDEAQSLRKERAKHEVMARTISAQMYSEAQGLLELFGAPYLISPMEAEAQCAYLDLTDQCDGSITEDSDVWLFGGKRVYKNFFNQDKLVEFFRSEAVKQRLGLDRQKLINIALMCGCDYTDGIQSVGPVTAVEIMAEFPGEGCDGLKKFKEWWDEAQKQIKAPSETKIKSKLRQLEIKPGFPSAAVIDAFINPAVDTSAEAFTWGRPDLDLLRDYATKRFGWTRTKTDELLLPVIKKMNEGKTQQTITKFFMPTYLEEEPRNVKSKRLKRALNRVAGSPPGGAPEPEKKPSDQEKLQKAVAKAKQVLERDSEKRKKVVQKGKGKRAAKKKNEKSAGEPVGNIVQGTTDEAGGEGSTNVTLEGTGTPVEDGVTVRGSAEQKRTSRKRKCANTKTSVTEGDGFMLDGADDSDKDKEFKMGNSSEGPCSSDDERSVVGTSGKGRGRGRGRGKGRGKGKTVPLDEDIVLGKTTKKPNSDKDKEFRVGNSSDGPSSSDEERSVVCAQGKGRGRGRGKRKTVNLDKDKDIVPGKTSEKPDTSDDASSIVGTRGRGRGKGRGRRSTKGEKDSKSDKEKGALDMGRGVPRRGRGRGRGAAKGGQGKNTTSSRPKPNVALIRDEVKLSDESSDEFGSDLDDDVLSQAMDAMEQTDMMSEGKQLLKNDSDGRNAQQTSPYFNESEKAAKRPRLMNQNIEEEEITDFPVQRQTKDGEKVNKGKASKSVRGGKSSRGKGRGRGAKT